MPFYQNTTRQIMRRKDEETKMKHIKTARLGRTAAALLLSGLLLTACASCGGRTQQTAAEQSSNETEAAADAASHQVDSINLELDEGILQYVRVEKADKEVTEEPNAYLFVFEYTNKQAEPSQAQDTFRIQYFQNGTEVNEANGFTVAGEQGQLANAFFNNALQGGKVTFGRIVLLNDESPVTVYAKRNVGDTDEYQMMEVAIDGASAGDTADSQAAAAAPTAEQVEAALQGTWILQGSNYFTFENGNISIVSGSAALNGTYEINLEDGTVDGRLQATDGVSRIHMPYQYDNGILTLYNNAGEALVRQ